MTGDTTVGPWIRIAGPRLLPPGKTPLYGTFVERPHRFAAVVTLDDGARVEAHLANPGRLTGVLSPGCSVLVDGPFPPPRALAYTMLAARVGRVWAGTVTTYANRVMPTLLDAGLFPELWVPEAGDGSAQARDGGSGDRAVRAEVQHGRSRFDFSVAGRFVEVKSVSLAEGRAGLFPDAVTARGARHCGELAALSHSGTPTAVVFVAQRADVESVAAADTIDPAFAHALSEAHRAGVLVLACALRMGPTGATAARRIPASRERKSLPE